MQIRPMEPRDVEPVYRVSTAAFDDLDRRFGGRPERLAPPSGAQVRVGRVLETDPGGAWVAERDGEVVGGSLAIMRDGIWGLSLLVVRPDVQSNGAGRELLARAWAYGDGARGRIVLASRDPRALRSYARLGLELHPAVAASGRARIAPPAEVREGGRDDLALTVEIDQAVRGAAHGEDILALLELGGPLLVLPGRGYAIVRGAEVRLLAARDPESAATLLRACLAATGEREASVEWITAAQGWAVAPCLEAGLELRGDGGAVFLAGDVGPFAPYLPNGTYL